MQHRDAAYAQLRGQGLEIGALAAPVPLPPDVAVRFVDVRDRTAAAALFPELDPERLARVDHVVDLDAEGLSRFADGSFDFVIANHAIARVADPIRFLGELFRVVRPGGHVVLSTADREYTAERAREETGFGRLLAAHRAGVTRVDDGHYLDFLAGVHPEILALPAADIQATVQRVRARREPVHVWSSAGFQAFLERAMELLGIRAVCVYERAGEETRHEHFSMWRVERGPVAGTSREGPGTSHAAAGPGASAVAQGRPVLLCGMHRSGTSVLARCLGSTGIWLGDEEAMLPAHAEDNPEGYWERKDVHDAHVEFFGATGYDWDRVAGFPEIDPDLPQAVTLRQRLQPVVEELQRHGNWLLKDPRLCLLLPVWRQLVPDFVPIVAVRDPLEVAGSLRRSPRGIYPTHFSLLLWEKYLLRCLRDLHERPAIFVSYANLLADPHRELQRIVRLLEAQGVRGLRLPDEDQLATLVRRDLRRNRRRPDEAGMLGRRQAALLARLRDAAEADTAVSLDVGDLPEPDAELAEYEAAFDSRVQRIQQLMSADAATRTHLHAAMLERIQGNQLRLARENGQLRERLLAMEQAARDLRTRLAGTQGALQALRSDLEGRLQAAHRHSANLEKQIASLTASLSWKVTAPLRWLGRPLRPGGGGLEQKLFRWYYRLPFPSAATKRRLVVWVHEYLPFLTRGTQSYAMYRASRGDAPPPAKATRRPRMDAERAARILAGLPATPLVSIVMPTWNTEPRWLQEAYDSLCRQFYPHWQLCIADDASTRSETLAWLRNMQDPRVKVAFLDRNRGIAGASNAALDLAEGEYVGLLDHDDVLAADALLESVRALLEGNHDIVYSDEDKIDVDGRHFDPHFKPGYSPDMLLSQNYICHFLVVRRSLLREVGGFREGFDGSQDHDLLLRLCERSEGIHRIPKVLYHWRMHAASTAADPNAKPASWQAGLKAVAEAMQRRGIEGEAEYGRFPHTYRVRRRIDGEPLVSIIVPFRDKQDLLRTCATSVLEKSTYRNFELLCVDNGSVEPETHELLGDLQRRDSRVRVLHWNHPFNYSAINNFAVRQARGTHLLFLNNDTEVIEPEWLEAMLEHSQRPEVGVVGAQLLYDDDTLQHAGVIAGLGGVAGHSHLNVPADHPGYFCRAHLIQDLCAVTFACAMTRRDVFERVGGLNETELRIAFNDVDYCFRALEQGYRVIYTPYARLYHYESKSRGYEDTPEKQARFSEEVRYMQRRHQDLIERGDPYYNPNFRIDCESFHFPRDYWLELP